MIPKIIHYCWFGKKQIPDNLQKCINSWEKLMPEYKIICWNEENFDINSNAWTRQAYENKKYAFVSDYVRLYVLKKYGGIYLDTDVMVLKSFDELLKYKAFGGFENDLYITSAVIGCEAQFDLINEFFKYYENKNFVENKRINNEANVIMMTKICRKYGLVVNNEEQEVNNFHIFPKEYFCPIDFYHNKNITKNSMAIHYFEASWLDDDSKKMITLERKWRHKFYIKIKAWIAEKIKG